MDQVALLETLENPTASNGERRNAASALLRHPSSDASTIRRLLRAPGAEQWLLQRDGLDSLLGIVIAHPATDAAILCEVVATFRFSETDLMSQRPEALANGAIRGMMLIADDPAAARRMLPDASDEEIPVIIRILARRDGRAAIEWIRSNTERARRLLLARDLVPLFVDPDVSLHAEGLQAVQILLHPPPGG
jgi:hypothetical protein